MAAGRLLEAVVERQTGITTIATTTLDPLDPSVNPTMYASNGSGKTCTNHRTKFRSEHANKEESALSSLDGNSQFFRLLIDAIFRLSRQNDDVTFALCYCAVALLAAGCYANGLHGEFVHDDVMAIVRNPDVKMESSVGELWSHDFWGQNMSSDVSHKSYRPLTVMTFR